MAGRIPDRKVSASLHKDLRAKQKDIQRKVDSSLKSINGIGAGAHVKTLDMLAEAVPKHAKALTAIAAATSDDEMLTIICGYVGRKRSRIGIVGNTKWADVGIDDDQGIEGFFYGIKKALVSDGFSFQPDFNDATVLDGTDTMTSVRDEYKKGLVS